MRYIRSGIIRFPPAVLRSIALHRKSKCYFAVTSKMIQLRNVPDELHRLLKARAALEGLSLSEYLLAEIRRNAERPTLRELRERLHQRTPVVPDVSPAEVIRELRDRL